MKLRARWGVGFALLAVPVCAQRPAETPGWTFSIEQGESAPTTATVLNRCAGVHRFSISAPGLDFVRFLDPYEDLAIAPGESDLVRLEFDSSGLETGRYRGDVVVRCLDCASELTCTQDLERFPVDMTVVALEAPAPAAQQDTPACECEIKIDGPAALCVGEKASFIGRYKGSGKGTVKITSKLEQQKGKDSFELLDAKNNPKVHRKSCSASTNLRHPTVTFREGGRYRVQFEADCLKKPVERTVAVFDLEKVGGPDQLYLSDTATKTDGSFEVIVEPSLGEKEGDQISWKVERVSKDEGTPPEPATGTGGKSTVTFATAGDYKITFRCKKDSVSKNFKVVKLDKATVTGPGRLCYEPTGGSGGGAACAEPGRSDPKGTWNLVTDPAVKGVKWRIERSDGNVVVRGAGAQAVHTFQRGPGPGCYEVIFSDAEATVANRPFLVVSMDLDVVVDGDLSSRRASPTEVPIYQEKTAEGLCYQMNLDVCRSFAMRFRATTRPAVPLEFRQRNLSKQADTDDKDRNNLFTGWYDSPTSCDPDGRRSDFFRLTPTADKGSLEVTATNPESGERHLVAKIEIGSPKPLEDLSLIEGKNKVLQELVKNNRLQIHAYFVEDEQGHRSEYANGRNESGVRVPKLFEIANTYWSQCGVCSQVKIEGDLDIDGDLGRQAANDGRNRIAKVLESKQPSPSANLALVHRVAGNQAKTVAASSSNRPYFNVFFSDPGTEAVMGTVLGHELLHGIADLDENHTGQGRCDLGRAQNALRDGLISGEQCTAAKAVVTRKLRIVDPELQAAKKGTAYEKVTLRTLGAIAPVGWSIAKGKLPDGMSLSADGVLSGTPTSAVFTYTFDVTATDARGATDTLAMSIFVSR